MADQSKCPHRWIHGVMPCEHCGNEDSVSDDAATVRAELDDWRTFGFAWVGPPITCDQDMRDGIERLLRARIPPEPGEAAKGGGTWLEWLRDQSHAEMTDEDEPGPGNATEALWALQKAESERDALQAKVRQFMACADALEDLANGKNHVQCLAARPGETTLECDATNPCLACKTVSRITALEAALAQAEEERERFLVLADHLSSGVLENVPTDRVWSVNVRRNASYLAAMVTRLRNPSPTRSARAEARSDGEGERPPWVPRPSDPIRRKYDGLVVKTLQYTPTGYVRYEKPDGQLGNDHIDSVEPALPPQPGGFGPDRALLEKLIAALRETAQWYANEQWASGFDRVADRLERKP